MGSDWKTKKIGQIITLQRGFDITRKEQKSGVFPVVSSSGIKSHHNDFRVIGPGVVIGRKGTLGTVFYINGNYWPHDTSLWVKDFKGNHPRFIYYFLQSFDFKSYNVGSSNPTLNRNHVHLIESISPPLPEQQAIAHILGTLDDKIELNRQMNETLEAMAQALFKSWFVDFDPVIDKALAAGNPIPEPLQAKADRRKSLGDKRKPLPKDVDELFPDAFVFSEEMGWIPEGWEVASVDQLVISNPKLSIKKGSNATYADMKSLPTRGFSVGEVIRKDYAGGTKFQLGDVLLARITPCLENGKTGIVDFLSENEIGFGSTEFIVLRGKGELKTPFVACLSRDQGFRRHCMKSMVGSSGRQRVQTAALSSYYLAIPKSKGILRAFHLFTSSIFDRLSKSTKESRTLENLRDTLLPKLISGELRVSDAEKKIAKEIT